MEGSTRPYQVQSVHRAISIMKLLADSEPMKVSDIARAIETPKTTCFMILQTLEQSHIVIRTDDNKYRIGHGIYDFVFGDDFMNGLRQVGDAVLLELANDLDMTVHMAVRQGNETLYVLKRESPGFVQFNTHVGQRHLLHLTSVGKAILMGMSDNEIKKLLPREHFTPKTEFTIKTPEQLLQQIADFRKMGYTIEDEEGEYGVRCVGAPIIDSRGRTIGAISVTELKSKLPDRRFEEVGGHLMKAAEMIARNLEIHRFKLPQ
ncbi:IclR family transcriptional regulator [Paenibacillaceae bacterium WGS1546]|uniref:IclR family transcriptional regulator n=1 Tax=Cohnella sp. WGS1546 TaxID=3366810 RepID=UPI00372D7978